MNTTADTVDAIPGNGVCADAGAACSLRAAIGEANALAGTDTITVPAGTYLLTRAGAAENSNATGDLDIRSDLTINGAGAAITILDANQLDRVVHVYSGTVTLDGLTLRNGKTPSGIGENCQGGALFNDGSLTLRNAVVRDSAADGADSNGEGCRGGGVATFGPLTLEYSTIRDIRAGDGTSDEGGYGGGVYVHDPATIRFSTISGNVTGTGAPSYRNGEGGGIYVESFATAILLDATLSGNSAGAGEYGARGGGVMNRGTTTLTHCTVTGNAAGNGGGGVDLSAGTLNLKNTIVAGTAAT